LARQNSTPGSGEARRTCRYERRKGPRAHQRLHGRQIVDVEMIG
jgi:hypothetical protein